MTKESSARWARYILTVMLLGGVWSYTCLYEPVELSTLDVIGLFPFYIGYALLIAGLKLGKYKYLAAGALSCCLSCAIDLLGVVLNSGIPFDYLYYSLAAAAYLFVFLAVRYRKRAEKYGKLALALMIGRGFLEMMSTQNPAILITLPFNVLSHGLPLLLIGKFLAQPEDP